MSTTAKTHPVRRVLQLAAVFSILATGGFWFAKDGRLGWSQNRVPVTQKDEITGIDYVTYEERFVPGVDTLGLGFGVGAGLFVVSFFFRSKSN